MWLPWITNGGPERARKRSLGGERGGRANTEYFESGGVISLFWDAHRRHFGWSASFDIYA